jgi:hypothetical protein
LPSSSLAGRASVIFNAVQFTSVVSYASNILYLMVIEPYWVISATKDSVYVVFSYIFTALVVTTADVFEVPESLFSM